MKHCTTDKCPQILDSSCVFYEGTSLIFSGINTNDSVETVIQKLNLKLESIPGINLDNYYTKTEVNTLIDSIDLSNYYTKNETYSKIEVDGLLDVIEVTKPELDVLISENNLEPNRLYKITGVESWCFSQHLIKAIYLKAITNNTLESEGVGEFYTPKYNTSDFNLGIWKGELLANGIIDSLSYNIGDKVIWGNLFWENISGEIGNNLLVGDLKVENYLSPDWELKIPSDNLSLYNTQFDEISYDINNDYINFRKDKLNNIYTLNINTLKSLQPLPRAYKYYLGGISLFQWGNPSIFNNNIEKSLVTNCNYKHVFKDNTIVQRTVFNDNIFLNVHITNNVFKNSSIIRNYLKSPTGSILEAIINNNLDSSSIIDNKYYFQISNNTLKNNSSISNNNDNNIIVDNRYSIINGNTLDNFSTISNNIFVEEGNGVSGYRKGIYDNVLTTYCNINNNTIKNGSRIFGHTMNYYSTINGNTLDTDANIYNNQLIQNGKIDNNILTGHGRIYGNQLDRASEITLCKLRISPATSYASGIHGNRLFTGKIQNVDFGNIVNPVGSDPNNPAFGGNALTGCIIENSSIIKDLTFPNHNGVGIQFVKMNGYSELKNITVNDPIKNVDFINTIFNETSDYSKLIEGSGYQTNGFTKTYIDGVLLKDRFDEKQDRLQDVTGNIGVGKTDASATEKLDVNGNVKAIDFKGKSLKFDLQSSVTPTPNTLVPKADGSGLLWYDNNSVLRNIGENFFSADLSNTTARNHTMNASVTVNTLGNPYSITGLPNKNADITNFRKVRVQNASGLDAVVDNKNLLTDGVNSMTDAEKDAWRLAQRKSTETYSIGQPQPFAVFPPIVENNNEIQEVVVVGSNLFLNNSSPSTALVCLVSETGTEYPLNVEVNQTNPSVLSFGYNFSTLPLGNYWIKVVHNGLVNINKVYLQVLDSITPQPLPNLSWNGYRQKTNTYFTSTNNTTDFVSFTPTAINFTRAYSSIDGSSSHYDEGSVFINSSAFNLPNDFYLEFSGTCPWQAINGAGGRQPTISMGLCAYNSVFDISNTYIAGFGLDVLFQNSKLFSDVSTSLDMGDVTNFVFYVIKKGSKIILGIKSKSGILYSTYTAPAGNQFMIKLAHFDAFPTSSLTPISFALTKLLSL